MHGSATPRLEHEILRLGDDAQVRRYKDTLLANRVGKAWGLVEWTVHTMRKWGASILLIEGKASGLTVHQELRRLHSDENWSIQLLQPKGDKVTRALAAQPTFAQGLVYAPVKDWSQLVIDEMELFPKGRYDDSDGQFYDGHQFLARQRHPADRRRGDGSRGKYRDASPPSFARALPLLTTRPTTGCRAVGLDVRKVDHLRVYQSFIPSKLPRNRFSQTPRRAQPCLKQRVSPGIAAGSRQPYQTRVGYPY